MITLLHKYGKTIAIVATQSLNDALWGLMGDFALRLFHVAILLSLWRTVMAGQGVVAGMSLDAVLTYTMIAAIFADQLSGRTRIDDDLWSGNIANRFLRPMGIYGQMLAEMVGGWIPGLLFFALPLFLIAPLLGVDPFPATWTAGLWFLLSLTLGVAVGTALDLFFAACMVFLEHSVYALQRIRTTLTLLLSGRLVPLALLPWGLGDYLEFDFMFMTRDFKIFIINVVSDFVLSLSRGGSGVPPSRALCWDRGVEPRSDSLHAWLRRPSARAARNVLRLQRAGHQPSHRPRPTRPYAGAATTFVDGSAHGRIYALLRLLGSHRRIGNQRLVFGAA